MSAKLRHNVANPARPRMRYREPPAPGEAIRKLLSDKFAQAIRQKIAAGELTPEPNRESQREVARLAQENARLEQEKAQLEQKNRRLEREKERLEHILEAQRKTAKLARDKALLEREWRDQRRQRQRRPTFDERYAIEGFIRKAVHDTFSTALLTRHRVLAAERREAERLAKLEAQERKRIEAAIDRAIHNTFYSAWAERGRQISKAEAERNALAEIVKKYAAQQIRLDREYREKVAARHARWAKIDPYAGCGIEDYIDLFVTDWDIEQLPERIEEHMAAIDTLNGDGCLTHVRPYRVVMSIPETEWEESDGCSTEQFIQEIAHSPWVFSTNRKNRSRNS